MAKVTIDDKEYETDDMSEDARAQLVSLQFVNSEIPRSTGEGSGDANSGQRLQYRFGESA